MNKKEQKEDVITFKFQKHLKTYKKIMHCIPSKYVLYNNVYYMSAFRISNEGYSTCYYERKINLPIFEKKQQNV